MSFFGDIDAPSRVLQQAQALAAALAPLSGDGPPSVTLGLIGSMYVDTSDPLDFVLYGPKTGTGWGTGRSLLGGPGPSNNTRLTLADLKAAAITDKTSLHDGSLWTWTPGDFTGRADDATVVKADGVALTVGAWSRQEADGVTYRAPGPDSITQTAADTVRRERLNLYDKIPKALWPAIEAGTNIADLTTYVMAALGTGRGVNARQGRFRIKLNVTEGLGLSIRGEGKHITYFENVDNTPIVTLDSSSAHIFGFELEDVWLENRDPVQFGTCDLLKITGAGDGDAFQNDKHHFRNLWFYRGRDNIVCDRRCIWPTWDHIESTGALRDAVHIETNGNVNQWSWRDCILKGAGRNALFFKHDFSALATGWTFWNGSFEDSGFEAIRFTGGGGTQGFGLMSSTLENNARLLAAGSSAIIEGVRRRKAQIHSDAANLIGLDISRTTFYNNSGGGSGGDPDHHIYVSAFDANNNPVVGQSGESRNSRYLATATGVDVIWPIGLTYAASNVNAGPVQLDEARQSIDMRKFTPTDNYTAVLTLTGVGGAPMGTARFVRQGDLVTAYIPLINGVSVSIEATLTGLPAALWPERDQTVAAIVQDSAGIAMGLATIQTGGLIVLGRDVGGGAFTASGTKGVRLQTLTWALS